MTRSLAIGGILVFGLLAGGACPQGSAPADSAQPAATPPDGSAASGGGPNSSATQSKIGRPPTQLTTTLLPYPRLTGIWAQGLLEPSLSEKFNARLPSWLRFSGEIRERFEGYSGGGFKPNNTDDYDLHRIRLGMLIEPASWLRFFIQMQDARVFARKPALPNYQNTLDIREACVQFGSPEGNGFSLKAGRQEIYFGNNRFLGYRWWTNVSRSYDGVRAAYQQGRLRIDAFAASVVIIREGVIDHHNQGNNLYGLYGTYKDVIPHATLETFEFWHVQPNTPIVGLKAGHLSQWTTGFRWVGALPRNFDYRTEMAYQLGTLTPDRIRAWTGHWALGYSFPHLPAKPRIYVEYNYASGSNNTASGVYSTFDPIYPSTHDKLGLADQFGWRNIQDLRFAQEFHIRRKWSLGADVHDFWLANSHDALYTTGGSIIGRIAAGAPDTHVGEELDAQLIYTPTRQTQVGFGYGRVLTGAFLNKTTKGKDYSYPYMLIDYQF
jgi:Alginate export